MGRKRRTGLTRRVRLDGRDRARHLSIVPKFDVTRDGAGEKKVLRSPLTMHVYDPILVLAHALCLIRTFGRSHVEAVQGTVPAREDDVISPIP